MSEQDIQRFVDAIIKLGDPQYRREREARTNRQLRKSAHMPNPSQEDINAAWERIKAADLGLCPTVATSDAVTILDAYLHTALKLKALEENT